MSFAREREDRGQSLGQSFNRGSFRRQPVAIARSTCPAIRRTGRYRGMFKARRERLGACGCETRDILLCASRKREGIGQSASRAAGVLSVESHDGTLYWFWIGSHDEYERILNRR